MTTATEIGATKHSHIAIRIHMITIRLVIRRAEIGWIFMAAPPMRTYCDVTSAQTILLKCCMQMRADAFSPSTRVGFFCLVTNAIIIILCYCFGCRWLRVCARVRQCLRVQVSLFGSSR